MTIGRKEYKSIEKTVGPGEYSPEKGDGMTKHTSR